MGLIIGTYVAIAFLIGSTIVGIFKNEKTSSLTKLFLAFLAIFLCIVLPLILAFAR